MGRIPDFIGRGRPAERIGVLTRRMEGRRAEGHSCWLLAGFVAGVWLLLHSGAAPAQAAAGQEVFRARCIGCHAIGCNRSGPKLAGLLGRKAGSVADFSGYTKEMKAAGFTWSRERLDKFLADPAAVVPGTAMTSAGKLASAADRKKVIDFIASGDTSIDLCF